MEEYNLKYVFRGSDKLSHLKIKKGEYYLFNQKRINGLLLYKVKNIHKHALLTTTYFTEKEFQKYFICFYENRKNKIRKLLKK